MVLVAIVAATTGLVGYFSTTSAEVDSSRNGHNQILSDSILNAYTPILLEGNPNSSGSFSLNDTLNRTGVIVGTIGSCIVFAAGHDQYPIELRVVIGIVSVVFVYPWIKTRTLWSPWIAHTLGDIIGDTIVTL